MHQLDVVTWHYYPQQSRRCAAHTLKAAPGVMLKPENLDEVVTWAGTVEMMAIGQVLGRPAFVYLGNGDNGEQPQTSEEDKQR